MRYLVCHHRHKALANLEDAAHSRLWSWIKQRARENYGAGILHAAKTRSTDYQREFFVRIRCNRLAEKLQRRIGRSKSLHRKILVSGWNIVSKRGHFWRGRLKTSKLPNGDNHAIWWDRN